MVEPNQLLFEYKFKKYLIHLLAYQRLFNIFNILITFLLGISSRSDKIIKSSSLHIFDNGI